MLISSTHSQNCRNEHLTSIIGDSPFYPSESLVVVVVILILLKRTLAKSVDKEKVTLVSQIQFTL